MTDGTSQGLFIVVAIVIFGIFTVLAYILFEDTLSPAMASMFNDTITEASKTVNSPLQVEQIENEDGTITIRAYSANNRVTPVNIQMLTKKSGFNLLANSDFSEPLDVAEEKYGVTWSNRQTNSAIDTVNKIDGANTLRIDTVIDGIRKDVYFGLNNNIEVGDTFTVSFYAMSSEPTDLEVRFGTSGGELTPEYVQLDSTPKRFSVTLTKQPKQNNNVIFRSLTSPTVWLSKIQVEFEEQMTDWKNNALDNEFNTVTKELNLTIDSNGTYEFLMIDDKGNKYLEEVVITKF